MALNQTQQAVFDEMSMSEKAAILLMQLGEDTTAALFSSMNIDSITAVSKYIAGNRTVEKAIATAILEEFHAILQSGQFITAGGLEYARELLYRTLGPEEAKKVLEKNANGKLFPSTYYLLPSTKEERIIDIMTETFNKKYKDSFSNSKIDAPLKNKEEIIVLASILEGEAKTFVDMKMVAGILLKRLSLNMPLQVDAAKETYKTKGLPVEPINNPGTVAIEAVLTPTSSNYLYYITGNDGIMHYSKTFEEHKRNIIKYLK